MRIFKAYVPNWSRKSDCSITSPLALSSSILQIQALLSFLSMQRMFSSKMFSCENNCLLFGQNDGTIKNSSFISIYIFQMIVQKPDYLNQLVTLLNKSIGNSDTFQITGSFKHILPFRQEIIITSSSSGIMALSQIISKCVFNTNKKKNTASTPIKYRKPQLQELNVQLALPTEFIFMSEQQWIRLQDFELMNKNNCFPPKLLWEN